MLPIFSTSRNHDSPVNKLKPIASNVNNARVDPVRPSA